jgi:hypothetical protein
VAQKSRPTCLYCGAPLEGEVSGQAASEAVSESTAETPTGKVSEQPRAAEATETPATPAAPPRPAAPSPPPHPAFAAPPEPSSSILRSGFLWLVVVLAAVVVGALVAGRSGEERPTPAAATTPEEALKLAAEGLEPETGPPPEAPPPERLETRTSRAQGSISLISQWIEAYASEYGHYPGALGVGLEALTQFSEDADMGWVLAPFEGGRIDYSRGVAAGGEEESYTLSATVAGTDRRVTARGSRRRGGDPRNPAPLR